MRYSDTFVTDRVRADIEAKKVPDAPAETAATPAGEVVAMAPEVAAPRDDAREETMIGAAKTGAPWEKLMVACVAKTLAM